MLKETAHAQMIYLKICDRAVLEHTVGRFHDHELGELVELTMYAQINSQLICDRLSSEIGACICA